MLKDDFNPKAPISQVPASWFNKVAKTLNGLVGGFRGTNGVCEAHWSWDNCLPIYGMKTPRETFCMIAKGMRFLYSTRAEVKDGVDYEITLWDGRSVGTLKGEELRTRRVKVPEKRGFAMFFYKHVAFTK